MWGCGCGGVEVEEWKGEDDGAFLFLMGVDWCAIFVDGDFSIWIFERQCGSSKYCRLSMKHECDWEY